MIYNQVIKAKFIRRINRFIAEVDIQGQIETVHVKNTGRCKELFIEGVTCYLEVAGNPNRKTKYSLIGIKKGDILINIDSQVPNKVVADGVLEGKVKEIGKVDRLKREVTYGKSRFDIYYEKGKTKGFIEVKGVTLEENGIARFPDAPTSRGTKHVRELIKAKAEGYEAAIMFLVQMKEVHSFETNHITDIEFAKAIEEAKTKGVQVLVYIAEVKENGIEMLRRL